MPPRYPTHFVVVGAGAAGLMTARELARAGKRATILEARGRCGGRIYPLSAEEFGYPAEGGAEFVHGAAPVLPSPAGGESRSADRRIPRDAICRSAVRRAAAIHHADGRGLRRGRPAP